MEILYEDKQLMVCYKEAGLPVQSARMGVKDLESILKNYLWEKGQEKGKQREPYLAVVHRLDQPVEGVLVFAKTPEAAKKLSAQLTDGRMKKTYLAVTHLPTHRISKHPRSQEMGEENLYEDDSQGKRFWKEKPDQEGFQEKGSWKEKPGQADPQGQELCGGNKTGMGRFHSLEDYLVKDGRTNTSRIGKAGEPGAKLAKLEYEILEREENKALVKIRLYTGRDNQIRVQMAGTGMPLYGDRKYGMEEHSPASLALCAAFLEFFHPGSGRKMRFSCRPKGEYFQEFASILESQVGVQGEGIL